MKDCCWKSRTGLFINQDESEYKEKRLRLLWEKNLELGIKRFYSFQEHLKRSKANTEREKRKNEPW